MCTVSWLHEDEGYRLYCNRDEKRTRRPALGPIVRARNGVRFLAPTDGDHRGTWIAVNEYAVSLCLLNGAVLSGRPDGSPTGRLASRGRVILEAASARSAGEVCERLWKLDLERFASFTLLALEPGRPAALIEWDGQEKAILPFGEPYLPIASSSVDPRGVASRRRKQFGFMKAGRTVTPTLLEEFHRSHAGAANAYSPCMHRPDAETVSFSQVRVVETEVFLAYSDGAPCRACPPETVRLRRR